MKKIFTLILTLILTLSSTTYAAWGIPVVPRVRSVRPKHVYHQNAIEVSSNDDLEAKYDWLGSGDRDTEMGAAAATNRRTLILTPGTYTLSSSMILDTEFVDLINLTGNPTNCVITRATGGETLQQTADDIRLYGFTVQNNGAQNGDNCFEINATDNGASVYEYIHFRQEEAGNNIFPVLGTSDIRGTWWYCEGDDYTWIPNVNKRLDATMYYCVAAEFALGGDKSGAILSGWFENCTAGNYSWASCTTIGAPVTGTFIDCTGGDRAWALGKDCNGTFIRCKAGDDSFGGWDGATGNFGTFSGYAIDCVSTGGNSFGQGEPNMVTSGTLIDCRLGTLEDYRNGITNAGVTTVDVSPNKASFTTALSGGANSNIIYEAVTAGSQGNIINIRYVRYADTGAIIVSANAATGVIGVLYPDDDMTATAIEAAVDGDGTASGMVTTTQVGTGAEDIENLIAHNLYGGADGLYCRGNHADIVIAKAANYTVFPFDSGAAFNNSGSTGAITFTLPAAVIGLEYSFWDIDDTATRDVIVDGDGAEEIGALGTTAVSDEDTVAGITIKCVVVGKWEVIHEQGVNAWD